MRLPCDNTLSGTAFKTNTDPRLNPDSGEDILRYFGSWSRWLDISWPEFSTEAEKFTQRWSGRLLSIYLVGIIFLAYSTPWIRTESRYFVGDRNAVSRSITCLEDNYRTASVRYCISEVMSLAVTNASAARPSFVIHSITKSYVFKIFPNSCHFSWF